jgi:hypothetical protein
LFFLNSILRETNKAADRGLQKQQEMGDKAIIIELQEEHDYAKKPHQEQPPRKVTKNVRGGGGQKRDYYYLKSVNSVNELDKFRFKVIQKKYC